MRLWKWLLAAAAVLAYAILAGYLVATSQDPVVASLRPGQKVLTLVLDNHKGEEAYRRAIARFEKAHPDFRVRLLFTGRDYYQKVLVMIAGGTPPDLLWMGQSFSEFAERGIFLDVTERIRRDAIDLSDYPPEVLSWYRSGGRYYGLPYGIDLRVLFVNLKLFREAGLPPPSDEWTMAEFLAAAQKLTKRGADGRVTTYAFRGRFIPRLFGAQLFDKAGNLCCNTPEMIAAIAFAIDLRDRYKVTANAAAEQQMTNDLFGSFRQGRFAIIEQQTFFMEDALRDFRGMAWQLALNPKGQAFAQWASSAAICIYRGTPYPEEAWALAKEFQCEDFQLGMAAYRVPARRSVAEKSVALHPDEPRNRKALLLALDRLAPSPRVPHLMELQAVYERHVERAMAGLVTPEQAMKECEADIRRRMVKFAAQSARFHGEEKK